MTFREFFDDTHVIDSPIEALVMGVFGTVFAFFTSYFLFGNPQLTHLIGISTVLFAVIISVSPVNKLLRKEEEEDYFWGVHKGIVDFYIYFFIGCFMAFFILEIIFPGLIFSQYHLLQMARPDTVAAINMPNIAFEYDIWSEIVDIFVNNMYVMFLAFILSVFYGAGSLFLIIFNSSVFAAALVEVIRSRMHFVTSGFVGSYAFIWCNLGIMFLHMIPEVGAYLIAAIGGGILSQALFVQRWSSEFYHVVRRSLTLLFVAVVVVFIAAVIEVALSKRLFLSGICFDNMYPVLVISTLFILGVLLVEFLRQRNKV